MGRGSVAIRLRRACVVSQRPFYAPAALFATGCVCGPQSAWPCSGSVVEEVSPPCLGLQVSCHVCSDSLEPLVQLHPFPLAAPSAHEGALVVVWKWGIPVRAT